MSAISARSRNPVGVAVSMQFRPGRAPVSCRCEHCAPIPGQVAEKLVGRRLSNFRKFCEAFCNTVAQTPELAGEFNAQSLRRMRNGNAPFQPEPEIGERSGAWELHHSPEIGRGGAVYDLSTITVVMPNQHDEIHYGRK
jgi:hypothetical protein